MTQSFDIIDVETGEGCGDRLIQPDFSLKTLPESRQPQMVAECHPINLFQPGKGRLVKFDFGIDPERSKRTR